MSQKYQRFEKVKGNQNRKATKCGNFTRNLDEVIDHNGCSVKPDYDLLLLRSACNQKLKPLTSPKSGVTKQKLRWFPRNSEI